MDWTADQRKIAEKYPHLEDIPGVERRYKCHTCHLIVDETPCPNVARNTSRLCAPLITVTAPMRSFRRSITVRSACRRLPGMRVSRCRPDKPGHRLPPGRFRMECWETAGIRRIGFVIPWHKTNLLVFSRYYTREDTLFIRGRFSAASTGPCGGLRFVSSLVLLSPGRTVWRMRTPAGR